jgi:hypothetical protein
VALALALGGLAAPGGAAETQWWILDSPGDYAKAESRGVLLRPDGALELGPRAESTPAESLSVIWAIVPLADGSMAIAGDRGRVLRWTPERGATLWAKLPVGQVLSLAAAGDGVVAGTGPDGLVYRVGARGDTALLARTGERYVWGLAPGPRGSWYAATGTRGRLVRIEDRAATTLLDTDESNLVSLVSDGRSGVFMGGDSRGRVFHVAADGTARTLFDASEDEIRGLARGADGALYAAALSASAVTDGDEPSSEGPAPVKSPVSGGRTVVYRIVPDSLAAAWWTAAQPMVYALLPSSDGILAATGNRAGVYRIERAGGASQLLAAPQGQVTALALGRDGQIVAGTSNPGVLWRLGPARAERGELLSPVHDARRIAAFGRVRWRGAAGGARVEIETRSGNTDTPDTTWSPWRGGVADPDGRRAECPPARYLQWRLRLAGGAPRLESVETAWRERNLAPRIDELVVAPQGQGFREGELTPRAESITQNLPGGQKVEYTMPSGATPRALRELPMWARGMRTVQWRASDPNGDVLRYRVEVRAEAGGEWLEVGDDLEAAAFTWDTNSLPDGRYRLRVTVSDAPGNALGEAQTESALSERFTVDNTPPQFSALDASGEPGAVVVRGRAEDGFSPLSRIEASLDDEDWRVVTPDGGLADDRALGFSARFADVKAGEHTLSVRVVDLAGNSAVRASRVVVPRER